MNALVSQYAEYAHRASHCLCCHSPMCVWTVVCADIDEAFEQRAGAYVVPALKEIMQQYGKLPGKVCPSGVILVRKGRREVTNWAASWPRMVLAS
eukprot:157708-Amphidinium_carterae.2